MDVVVYFRNEIVAVVVDGGAVHSSARRTFRWRGIRIERERSRFYIDRVSKYIVQAYYIHTCILGAGYFYLG